MNTSVPFVKSRVPWLGYGIAFGKDADKLLAALQQEHGNEFTIVLGGRKFTFLLNPHDYPEFLKQSKTLKADEISMEISGKAFGIDWSEYNVGVHEVQVPFDKSMRRNKVGALTEHMHSILDNKLHQSAGEEWKRGDLFRFVAKLIFDAGGEALMGKGIFNDESLFEEFLHFDSQFPLLITGLPRSIFFRRSDRFLKKMYDLLKQPNPGQSTVMDERFRTMEAITTVEEMGRNNAGLFWATQANTVVMAFYSVFFILRDKEARPVILEEVNRVLGQVQEHTKNNTPILSSEILDQMEALDACLDEVLRIRTASMPIRKATEDTILQLKSGRVLQVKKGDIVTLYPRTTHMNPEIYPQPEKFIWNRFLGKQGPNKFFYRGEPIKYNLMPFGGGKSICPGRHFARNEFKVLTATLLYLLDIDLLEEKIPDFDKSRAGLGALTPISDVSFRYRLKAQREKLTRLPPN